MKTDTSMASFLHPNSAPEKATKLLTGTPEPLAPDPMAEAVHADESPDSEMLEVVDYHQ